MQVGTSCQSFLEFMGIYVDWRELNEQPSTERRDENVDRTGIEQPQGGNGGAESLRSRPNQPPRRGGGFTNR